LFVGTQSSQLTFFTHTTYHLGFLGNLFIVYPLTAELLQYGAAQPHFYYKYLINVFIFNINIFDAANSFHLNEKIYEYIHYIKVRINRWSIYIYIYLSLS